MSEELEGYITVQEAAQTMGRSTEQIRRYLREGKLAGRRIGGQWFIREVGVLYRTGEERGTGMDTKESGYPESRSTMAAHERLGVFERINRRREAIRHRWEELGVHVDAVELIREMREEEP